MNLRQLEVFREVMLSASVSGAARNLGRTQPAISAALANLERHIGYRLFERRGGRLHPVPEAYFLLDESERILERMGALDRSMREGGEVVAGQLRLVCMPVISEFFMPRLIARFAQHHPESRFHLVATSSPQVYERIAAQQYDVGLAERGPGSQLVREVPFQGDCLCALAAGDALAGRAVITPADLDGRPCATFLPDHYIARELQQVFAASGAHLNVRFELQNAAAQFELVSRGAAFGVLSPLNAWLHRVGQRNAGDIRFVPLRPAIPYRFAILTPAHRPLSRLAQDFQALMRSELDAALASGADPAQDPVDSPDQQAWKR